MQGGAVPRIGDAGVDQPLGLYRRGRVRDFGPVGRGRRSSPTRWSPIERVKPIGLGARDSLRLEAGLPLYGHDLDRTTTPVDGRPATSRSASAAGPRAASRAARGSSREMDEWPGRKSASASTSTAASRCARARCVLDGEGNEVGRITSGGFSPILQRPIAMGYVASHLAEAGTAAEARAARQAVRRDASRRMPFVPHRYHRKGAAA